MNLEETRLLEDMSTWPRSLKYGLLFVVGFFVLGVGYWQDLKKQSAVLEKTKGIESELQIILSQKQKTLQNKPEEKETMAAFTPYFYPLSEKIGLTLLIEALSHQSALIGLTIEALRLSPAKEMDFYKEYPIEITLIGTYQQLYEWIFYVATQEALITLEDFAIRVSKENKLIISLYLKAYEYIVKEEATQHQFLMLKAMPGKRARKTLLRDPFMPLAEEMAQKMGVLMSADGHKKWELKQDPLKGHVYAVSGE